MFSIRLIVVAAAAWIGLSASALAQVERYYKSGQELFGKGALTEAIGQWEKVLNLAPDYMSIREYLVKAYKFVGVEQYSQNQLGEAIASWKKAIQLEPANSEIIGYIQRAENEIRNLKELSYDDRP